MVFIDKFLEIEQQLNLYNLNIDGFYYWRYIRTDIYNSIQENLNETGNAFDGYHLGITNVLLTLKNFVTNKSYKMPNKESTLLLMCHPRRVYEKGLYHTIYTDFITDCFDTVTVERPYQGKHYQPCYSKNIFYLDKFYYLRALLIKIKYLQKISYKTLEKELSLITKAFLVELNYELNIDELCKRIKYLHRRYLITKEYFAKIIFNVKPKLIVEVVHYNFENMVMNEVAHETGIFVVELQHGLMGKHHSAYNYSKVTNLKNLPDMVLFFSDAWLNSVRLPENIQKIATGFYFYDQMRKAYRPQPIRKAVMFISSGTVGQRLSRLALEFQSLIMEKGLDLSVIYKLHPGEYSDWKKRYPWLMDTNVTVIDTPLVNIYELFSYSIAQVGVYSTALFEGLGYDLKTFVMKDNTSHFVDIIFDYGAARLVSTAEDIFDGIVSTKECHFANIFWKMNAGENVINVLNALCNK